MSQVHWAILFVCGGIIVIWCCFGLPEWAYINHERKRR